jgi:PAS domain S-box-containing protein
LNNCAFCDIGQVGIVIVKRVEPDARAADGRPVPAIEGEDGRARVLASYGLDELEDDPELSAIVRFAAELTGSPIALVSITEDERLRFLAREGLDAREAPRTGSFCAHAMLGEAALEVCNALDDPRFSGNGLVTGAPYIRFYAGAPLVAEDGTPLGALCVIDPAVRPEGLTELQHRGLAVLAQAVMRHLGSHRGQRAAAAQAGESARAMREIADLVPAIIWSADAHGRFDYYNSRWNEATGLPRPESASDWLDVVHPDDTASATSAWTESFAKGQPFEVEFRLKQADGSWRWMMARALPFHAADGAISRWYGTLTDIDDTYRQSENRDILARELSHRIKNIFAVVAGLVSIRARRHEAAKEFADDLIASIRALGRAHDFVRPMEGLKGDSLRGLLRELMAPYAESDERITIDGKDCSIGARAATPLALIFHELATNSAKYGALSADGGRVEIEIECPEGDGVARIDWRERGGQAPVDRGADGFGSRLVQMSIEGQLGGRMERRFAPEGLEVDLEIPVASIRN